MEPTQLTEEELRNLEAVIKDGIDQLSSEGEDNFCPCALHDHDNAGLGSLSSWILEY